MRSIILSTSIAFGLLASGSAFAQAPNQAVNPGAQPAAQTGAAATQTDKEKMDHEKDKRARTGQNASTSNAPPAGSTSTRAPTSATGVGANASDARAADQEKEPARPAE